jgi:acyl-CoA thioesterase-1
MQRWGFLLPLTALAFAACGGGAASSDSGRGGAEPAAEKPPTSEAARAKRPDAPLVLFLGDSLTAGYGLSEEEAFPALVAGRLAEMGIEARVVNAGVSGDTTAGGLTRLPWLLRQKPAVVVVALGGNDGLRGLPLAQTEENLRGILKGCKEAGAEVILAGMLIPPNYGADYFAGFRDLFPRLSRELDLPLIPFLLEGVAAEPDLNLPDGIHPTSEGQKRVTENVLPYVLEALGR